MNKWYKIFCEADGAGGGGEPGGAEPTGGEPGAGGGGDPSGGDPAGGGSEPAGPKNIFEAGDDPAEQVPEEYQFNLGEGLEISDDLKARFTEIAKGAKLTQSQTDALMKMHSDVVLDMMHQAEEQANNWAAECQKQGLLTKENIAFAKNAVTTFGGDEALQVLVSTGAANHPAIQKMLQNIGSLLAEDTAPDGKEPPKEQRNDADILFANSKY